MPIPPNFTMQLAFCLKNLATLFAQSGLTPDQVEQAIRANLGSAASQLGTSLSNGGPLSVPIAALFPPNPAVDAVCNTGLRETAGIWLEERVIDTADALNDVSILPNATFLALNITQATIQKFVDAVWAAIVKAGGRLDRDGTPSSTGKIEITKEPVISSPSPTVIQLTVDGNYHNTEVVKFTAGFKLISTQTLRVQAGAVLATVTNQVQLDDTAIKALQVLGGIGVGGLFPNLMATFEGIIEDAVTDAKSQVPGLFNFGQLIAPIAPQVFLLPNSAYKLLIAFDAVTCDLQPGGKGITVSTQQQPQMQKRAPFLLVSGQTTLIANLAIITGTTYPATYTVLLGDLDFDSDIVWTDNHNNVVANGFEFNANLSFANLSPGHGRTFNFSVAATTKSTGLTATHAFAVTVNVINQKPAIPKTTNGPISPLQNR